MVHDRELMEALPRGDERALGTLYDRHGSRLFALCLRILRDPTEAEELTGDIFLELWRRPERYDPQRGNLLAYLITLTRSRAIDRLRARKRDRRIFVDQDDAAARREAAPAATPLEDVAARECRDRVGRAIATLAPEQRRAIELAFYDGLSHSEIAAALREPLGTVKSRIRNGLVRLRDSLRIAYGGGEA